MILRRLVALLVPATLVGALLARPAAPELYLRKTGNMTMQLISAWQPQSANIFSNSASRREFNTTNIAMWIQVIDGLGIVGSLVSAGQPT